MPLQPVVPAHPDPDALAELRRLLGSAGFTEAGICARLGLDDIYGFQPTGRARRSPDDLLDVLVTLFMDGGVVAEAELERWAPAPSREALDKLGLLARPDPERVHATVVLYPTRSLLLVSDSPIDPLAAEPRTLPPDAVYPAITGAARDFVSALPPRFHGRVLELCSGTGIGALLAARSAERAWAVDITERSTRFAAFNAALNGLTNVTALEGDLYAPVAGERFDAIVAHPPYMPADEVRDIYRDAGPDGEEVTRRILEGLGAHLAPGGRFHCTCMLTDREGVDLEHRIRGMLGDEADGFDLLLMPMRSVDPRQSLFDEALTGRADLEQSRRREEAYRELGVRELVYCSMVLQRRTGAGPARTLRRPRGPETDGAAIEWLLEWELGGEGRTAPPGLADVSPSPSPHVRASSELTLQEGRWHPSNMTLHASRPFPTTVRCAPWVLELLARCDGSRTVRDLVASLVRDGLLSPDAPEAGLLDMVRSLVSAGLLTVPGHPLPEPTTEPPDRR